MSGDFTLALHALVYLSRVQCTASSDELAKNICTHPVRVRKVMARLKRAGLVEAKQGRPCGGYLISKAAARTTLCHVAAAVDAKFVRCDWRSGDIDMPCFVASGMASVMDGIYSSLNELCYKRLEQTTLADVMQAMQFK